MKRTFLLYILVGTIACSGDEEPIGGVGAAGSSGSSGQSGNAGAVGGSSGNSTTDGSSGSSIGGASGSSTATDASDVSQEQAPFEGGTGGAADAGPTDAAFDGDSFACPPPLSSGGTFPDVLRQGIWLIGWSGGLDHYSWLRFNFITDGGLNGLLQVKNAGPNNQFFPCEGNDGLFSVNPSDYSVVLQMPQSCADSGYIDTTIKFPLCYRPGGNPKNSLLHATFAQSKAPMNVDGYMFPLDYCGASFTSCPSPFP
jgi:hypothetical protein